MMHRNKSVDTHQFAMVPRADIPRARFKIQKAHKTTFDSGYLVPVMVEEVLPGDTFNVKMTAFARLATPIFPIMDNMYLESFFFFVPNRLVWEHWKEFMGEQPSLGTPTSYSIPLAITPLGGYPIGSVQDHMGLPTVGQLNPGDQTHHNVLPLRMYNMIFNEWFRDQNLVQSRPVYMGDAADPDGSYVLCRRGKRHDYFTSALPWPQKGPSVSLPLGTSAPVMSTNAPVTMYTATGSPAAKLSNAPTYGLVLGATGGPTGSPIDVMFGTTTGLYADLSVATAATINQLRQSFQIQKLLERDARGGTRYTELVRAHFGVVSPDARLQRPEYLGGGSTPIVVNPVTQTTATGVSGSTTPIGTLSATATALAHGHGFKQSFTEHGYIIGLVNLRADLTYQQGMRKHWLRFTKYDFYFPAFAMLGEQAITMKEIYITGNPTDDAVIFGYQERWAEYRHSPSSVAGLFRSTAAGTLDAWHLAQRFTGPPVLGETFISDQPPLERILAVGAEANGAQVIFDSFFDMQCARPMPLYSVPGMIDHF